jgi:hypothetical protein
VVREAFDVAPESVAVLAGRRIVEAGLVEGVHVDLARVDGLEFRQRQRAHEAAVRRELAAEPRGLHLRERSRRVVVQARVPRARFAPVVLDREVDAPLPRRVEARPAVGRLAARRALVAGVPLALVQVEAEGVAQERVLDVADESIVVARFSVPPVLLRALQAPQRHRERLRERVEDEERREDVARVARPLLELVLEVGQILGLVDLVGSVAERGPPVDLPRPVVARLPLGEIRVPVVVARHAERRRRRHHRDRGAADATGRRSAPPRQPSGQPSLLS